MTDTHEFLKALTTVLCVAAVTTVIFQRLKQPVVLGYIIAGLIIGPHVPIPLIANSGIVHTLSELGVILLMFSLGLEFSLRKLIAVGPTATLTAIVQCSLMFWIGFVVGSAFGWTTLECVFTGAILAISSTTIIAKAFDEQNVRGRLRELVVGVLVVEDLIAILLMATLTAVASRGQLSPSEFAIMSAKLGLFLAGLVGFGMLLVPRTIRLIATLKRGETLLIASIGICFGVALLAESFGYSVALGAFIAGSLISESGEDKRIEKLVESVRDIFAAVFFVSVGMLIEPKLIVEHWPAILALTFAVVIGKVSSVSLGAFLTGNGLRTSVQAGLSLAQIGEFSFILAALGRSLDATGSFLYPVAVTVSAATTLLTPILIRQSGPAASWLDSRLPRALQTFISLYGSWWEGLGQRKERSERAKVRRALLLLAVDTGLLGLVVVLTGLYIAPASSFLSAHLGLSGRVAYYAIIIVALLCAVPFCLGIARLSRRVGTLLAEAALPKEQDGKVDFAAAPRRLLLVTLQIAIVLVATVPLLAVTQPFVSGLAGSLVLLSVLASLGLSFWRGAKNLHGHVRAGAEVVVQALAKQSHSAPSGPRTHDTAMASLSAYLPGLGNPAAVVLVKDSPGIGKTLAELNLRSVTGATVLAIVHGDGAVVIPKADERLRPGDVLAVAGTSDAVIAVRSLLDPSMLRAME